MPQRKTVSIWDARMREIVDLPFKKRREKSGRYVIMINRPEIAKGFNAYIKFNPIELLNLLHLISLPT